MSFLCGLYVPFVYSAEIAIIPHVTVDNSVLQCTENQFPSDFERLDNDEVGQFFKPGSMAVLSPNAHWFREMKSGEQRSTNMALKNKGHRPITLTQINGLGGDFSFQGTLPITIAAGTSQTLAFSFTPQASSPASQSSTASLVFSDGIQQKMFLWGQNLDG